MSDTKKNWLDKTGVIHLWNTIKAVLDDKVDKIEGMGLSTNDFTTEEKEKLATLASPDVVTDEKNGLMSSADKVKLDGIEKNANNYAHPIYDEKQAGLYRISVDKLGHVATADKMTSEELTAEGISPADHTHDLGDLAEALDTSSDAVEDADTVVVGETAASEDGSGAVTKYTRRPLAALWNWIKGKTDSLYAAAGHTHNYAGANEPGGDALNAMKLKGYDVSSKSAGYWNVIPAVGDDGVMEAGKYIDFHTTDDKDTDFDARFVAIGDGQILLNKTSDGNGDGTLKANLLGNAETASYANGTIFDKATTISVANLDANTWYPVVSTKGIPWNGMHRIKCNVQLNSGTKPSWSTHGSGFTVNLDMLVMNSGWGTTGAQSIVLDNSYSWTSSGATPVGYSQMNNSGLAVFWVRGGGSYKFYADWDAQWQLQTGTYTSNSQSVAPKTSYPGVSYSRATLDQGGFTIRAQTSDPGANSSLSTGTVLLVYA